MFRLKDFRTENNLKQSDVARIIDCKQPNIAAIEKGKDLTDAQMQKLKDEFGDEYVLSFYVPDTDVDLSDYQGVPYYENIDISGGIMPMFNDSKEIPTFYIDYQHFNDCTAYLPVVGDSMYPRYASGEIVAVKQIFNKEIIQWGEAYLVICNDNADNLRTIKLVHPSEKDESKIILRASNPNYKGDTPINKDDIISMFIIKGKITRNQL